MHRPRSQAIQTTNRLLAAAVIFALCALFLYGRFFFVVKSSTENTAALQEQVSSLEAQEAEVDKLKKNFAATKEQQQTLSSYFIDMNNPVPFFETIEAYGKGTGAKVAFDSVAMQKNPGKLDAVITASGSFSGIYDFLALLEAAPYEFSIASVDIQSIAPDTASAEKGMAAGWQAHVALTVFSVTDGQ